ncbi:hypothetical protein pb186bvf_003013 [Paramecium bursaria]
MLKKYQLLRKLLFIILLRTIFNNFQWYLYLRYYHIIILKVYEDFFFPIISQL